MRQIHRAKLAERYLDKRVNKNSRSGHTGVCWRENMQKYYAYIMVDRKQIQLGYYEKLEGCHRCSESCRGEILSA